MILAALAVLGATIVAFVLYPVFAQRTAELVSDPGEIERELSDLEEKKARLYETISDLDFEKESGKVSQTDYETARNDYLAQVSAILTRQDELRPGKTERKKATPPAEQGDARPELRRCASCGASSPREARFCIACGLPFEARCESCGQELPSEARFCMACGTPRRTEERKAHETA